MGLQMDQRNRPMRAPMRHVPQRNRPHAAPVRHVPRGTPLYFFYNFPIFQQLAPVVRSCCMDSPSLK